MERLNLDPVWTRIVECLQIITRKGKGRSEIRDKNFD